MEAGAVASLPVAPVEIVSGGYPRGGDAAGEASAAERGLPVQVLAVNWDAYGRVAGPHRNARLAYSLSTVYL